MAIDPTTTNSLVVGYVIAGHDAKPDPNQAGLCKVALSQYYGPDVKEEHIGYSQMVMPPNQGGATEFNGVPDPGQQVLCLKVGPPGASDLLVLGSFPTQQQDGSAPGNMNLMTSLPLLQKWASTNVLPPPIIKELIKDGARIRQIFEKGIKHNHELLKGISSNGAIYPLAGVPQKQLTNISTATQAFANILTSEMMAALPGTVFSIGNLLNSLSSSVLDELLSSMPPQLAQGVQNLFNLMQTIETAESGGFNTMGKVDPTTYLANAVNLLKGNQSFGEVVSNIQRLQYDTGLFGLDKLANASFDIPTAFGVTKMFLSPTGAIINEAPEAVQKAYQAFSTLMTSGPGFPNATLGNMFGESASVMSSLFNRLPPDKQTNAKNMMEKVIDPSAQIASVIHSVAKAAHSAQNLADLFD